MYNGTDMESMSNKNRELGFANAKMRLFSSAWPKETSKENCRFPILSIKPRISSLQPNPFPNKPLFCVCSTSLLKTLWEKEKLLITSNFCFSHSIFYLFGELSDIYLNIKIVACKLSRFGRGLEFVAWERVDQHG